MTRLVISPNNTNISPVQAERQQTALHGLIKILARIWPIRLPDVDGKLDSWNASAHEAARMAEGKWIRVSSNRSLGAYDIYEATGAHAEPEWPNLTLEQILHIAFKGHYIDNRDHIVLRKLRGDII